MTFSMLDMQHCLLKGQQLTLASTLFHVPKLEAMPIFWQVLQDNDDFFNARHATWHAKRTVDPSSTLCFVPTPEAMPICLANSTRQQFFLIAIYPDVMGFVMSLCWRMC
jgi:hypothetical protein